MENFKNCWRLELFYKSGAELKHKTLPFLREHGVKRINLTNKTKSDHLVDSATTLADGIKSADVCVHYSLKWNYAGGVDPAYATLLEFLSKLADVPAKTSVLLVSGGGKKKRLDTVEALRRLKDERKRPKIALHVAFNPYFPDDKDAREEQQRMKQKLATGLVSGIWLQTGSDVGKLESGLKFLQAEIGSSDVSIYGSVFLPTKKLLAQMRYRPWNGVFLSDEYLGDVGAATRLTGKLLGVYRRHGVTPLLETALKSTQDIRSASELLGLS